MGTDHILHVPLLIRDVWNLDVQAGSVVPPRLEGPVPQVWRLLDTEQLQQAAAEWRGWWNALLTRTVRVSQEPPSEGQRPPSVQDQRTPARTIEAETRRIYDPPGFEALADRPALQAAARHAFPGRDYWQTHDRQRRQADADATAQLDWRTVRDAVKEVATRHRVKPHALHGYVAILIVEGTWWAHIAPGVITCSANATRDPGTARTILTEAFESSLQPR